ncbi:MAG TPA: hypothetical protein VGM51_08715 [Armatimonadota bacterium]|jgi:hypothetical protein
MRSLIRNIAICALLGTAGASAQVTVGVDSTKAWIGYMNVTELSGAAAFSSAWATADLPATFNGTTLTLTPNTNIDATNPLDPYWWTGPGPGTGNKIMEALFYVEDSTTLPGKDVTFSGNVIANTLVSPYASVIFIKDFAPDFSTHTGVEIPVVPGPFSIHFQTTAGDHVQYGFATKGPNARLSEVAGLGSVQITATSSPVEEVTVGLDPAAAWIGYMNWFSLPTDGGAYIGGSVWAVADLPATWNGAVLTTSPNTSISVNNPPGLDPLWWKVDPSGPGGYSANRTLEALVYVQNDTTLPGKLVHFTGKGLANTLVSPYSCNAFVRDFNAGYSAFTEATAPLVNGTFTVTLQTHPGDHVQYGFDTKGPPAQLANVATLGSAQMTAAAVPYTVAEAVTALKEWGGLAAATAADVTRFDIETPAGIQLTDVLRIVRKVNAKDPNP